MEANPSRKGMINTMKLKAIRISKERIKTILLKILRKKTPKKPPRKTSLKLHNKKPLKSSKTAKTRCGWAGKKLLKRL